MCNGTKTHWRCKCCSDTCPQKCRTNSSSEHGHPWETHNYGAYFFCDDYMLSDRFEVGHRGSPPCPKGVTMDVETRYRSHLCPGCVQAGCSPIDNTVRFMDTSLDMSEEQKKEVNPPGYTRTLVQNLGNSRPTPKSSSVLTSPLNRCRFLGQPQREMR
ncbi:hypothetical protein NKR19_g5721 [Coniochaeta hoffmannii]|uniref:Uncharacterized protein n=1 Tax=Coniochaeta hoffmannii TaxID=91930 RepID=A0AA38RW41_9PEZI|nr:hypothetical protein NKR19_g5721 [Coniochaeta hoffmannii]